jgi:hypothetical protein
MQRKNLYFLYIVFQECLHSCCIHLYLLIDTEDNMLSYYILLRGTLVDTICSILLQTKIPRVNKVDVIHCFYCYLYKPICILYCVYLMIQHVLMVKICAIYFLSYKTNLWNFVAKGFSWRSWCLLSSFVVAIYLNVEEANLCYVNCAEILHEFRNTNHKMIQYIKK